MSISIIKPGILDTIQDSGRPGYADWGINPGGPMDTYAATLANLLAGSEKNAAVVEVHFPAPQILFRKQSLIALTGGDFQPTLNDIPLPLCQPVVVKENTILHFPSYRSGARCYLAIEGGFATDKWLGSRTTNLNAGATGLTGRKLAKNDELSCGPGKKLSANLRAETDAAILPWRADTANCYNNVHEISCVPGNEWGLLDWESKKCWEETNFIIHPSSDRMGYQLKNEPLKMSNKFQMVSTGVSFGTIQLLPNGQLVVLMADHQTTGGYPRIAHVVSAHLPKLAQLRPSDCIKFGMVKMEEAEKLYQSQIHDLNLLQESCMTRLNEYLCR
ncbi:MAG: biotin-dependent carboxyltransferase family protein [Gemmatimonadaceae bacterium]|nr:biotin-dependent carboxyltransferase family protein [Chitinophagaceae bacterium]